MRKYIKFILLFLFAVFLLWFFGRDLDWALVSQSLRKANAWYLGIAVLIICLGYLLRAIRWKVLLEPITESSLKELFATTTVGFAAIFLVGRAGELVRPMWLPMRDHRVRPSAALVTLGLERIFDLAAIVCFFSANLLFFTPPPGREEDFRYVTAAGIAMLAAVAMGFVFLIVYQRTSSRVIDWTEKVIDRRFVPRRIQRIILSILTQLAAALAVLKDWRETFWIVFWTFTLWLAISVPTWLVLLAFGLPLTFSDSLFIMGFAVVSSVVPTPGGAAGAFHTATAASLIFLMNEIRTEDAAAVAIAMHLVYFAPAIVFGLYYFVHGDISIERFRSLLSGDKAVEEIESDAPGFDGEVQSLESKAQSPRSKV
ncbi:MAG TPA: lysylphosphatidylglycerol synthase transmembrane domain-containing protein [Pyrinomonadaceae bacterium]|nr:lysylphosphatidylglycerol synthase transmembrane domain-containing protein [Pyrinomonadaceae bacterium]